MNHNRKNEPIATVPDGEMIAVAGCFEYLGGAFADTALNASASDDM